MPAAILVVLLPVMMLRATVRFLRVNGAARSAREAACERQAADLHVEQCIISVVDVEHTANLAGINRQQLGAGAVDRQRE